MFRDISVNELQSFQQNINHTLIDVRSPQEFQEATIPGSINIPIFSDEERSEVGTIYKQVGKEEAEKKGLEIFSKKLPTFVETFRNIQTEKTVFCWRGGMRSKTAATVVDLMGISIQRLTGGIRAYREWVVDSLAQMDFRPSVYVLDGFTGTGKTILLQQLKKLGYPVIDLEKMAGHRGSIFGQIGLKPNNQRSFDALLLEKLQQYEQEPFVFVEGESKRIGKVLIPDVLFNKKQNGFHFLIDLPMEVRVQTILDDYQPWKRPNEFEEAFHIIKKHIHTPVRKQIAVALTEKKYAIAVELLLKYYYDPRYSHANRIFTKDQQHSIQAVSVEDALEQITQTVDALVL